MIVIRRMRLDDIDAVMEIERLSFASPWAPESFVGEMEEDLSWPWILEVDDRAAAFAICRVILDEAHLLNIAVHPDFRGQHVSRHFMAAVFGHAYSVGARQMFLEVRPKNQVARALYASIGFYPIGRRKRYYEDGEDAIVMECRLSPPPADWQSNDSYQVRL